MLLCDPGKAAESPKMFLKIVKPPETGPLFKLEF